MNKEEIYDLLNRLDLQEWCTELYKVPLTWCELYDIRDYIINLEQQVKKQKEVIDKLIEYLQEKYDSSSLCGIVLNFTEFEDIKDLLKEVE